MYDLAIIHICTIGIPYYALQILEYIIYRKRKEQYTSQVHPQSNVQNYNQIKQINYKGLVKEEIQVNQKNQIKKLDKNAILSPESDQDDNEMLNTGITRSIGIQNDHLKDSQDNNRYFELLYNIFLLVSCTVFVYGATLSIQGHYQLKTQSAGEIIAIIIINQCFILILYNGIYKRLIEYLHVNCVKQIFFKLNKKVTRFYIFSYNIFMLLAFMPHERLYSNPEIIAELVNLGIVLLPQFILSFVLKKCYAKNGQN